MTIEDSMRALSKRIPGYLKYELETDENGKIQSMDAKFWLNVGSSFNETQICFTMHHFINCYDNSTWNLQGNEVKTELPSNGWCRSPG